jgi:hypothetical protein
VILLAEVESPAMATRKLFPSEAAPKDSSIGVLVATGNLAPRSAYEAVADNIAETNNAAANKMDLLNNIILAPWNKIINKSRQF